MNIHPYKLGDAKVFINQNRRRYKNPEADGYSYAIIYNNQFAGSIGVHHIIKGHKANIGYWLAESFWAQGIMTNVVKKFTAYLFKKYNLKRVYADVFPYNNGSKRVLEKAGFELEGIKKKDHKKNNKFIDVYLMAKVK